MNDAPDPVRKLLDDAVAGAPELAKTDDEFVTSFFQAVDQMEHHYRGVPADTHMVLATVPLRNLIRLRDYIRKQPSKS